jgi:hypothetical protein
LCNVCVCHCIFSIFIKNMFVVINCTRLKSTFGIRAIIGFRGMPLWSKGLAWVCDKPCYSGRSMVLILQVKRNGEQFKNRDREI